MSHLLEFFGTECPHCVRMHKLVDTFEVWHNKENAKKLEEIDKDFCGGVPFFYNTESKKWICGEAEYDELKEWATGK
jgi:thiol-disulfide isomerase/thioredoxin